MAEKIEQRPFAVFDIDGTLLRWQLYHAIADRLVSLGYIEAEAFQQIKDARMAWKRREPNTSFKDYEHRLVDFYTEVMTHLKVSQFEEAVDDVFDEYKDQSYTYTRDLINKLKEKEYLLFAISGSQTEIVEKIANHYGFDDFVGSTYLHDNERFTGKAVIPVGKKHEEVERLVKKHKATYAGSIAVGDSVGDISMLEAVENPTAFNPESKLFDYAESKGWSVVLERKDKPYVLEYIDGQYVLAKTSGR